ncbi:MAG: GNAT family N-acetyltransferase [Planctomycetaceae bacterium]
MFEKLKAFTSRLEQIRADFGWRVAADAVLDRAGRATVGLQVMEVIWLDASQVSALSGTDPRFTFRFLRAEEVRRHARDPELKLSPDLAARIEAGRDLCYAALEGDRLAAYGWYALDSIEGEHNFGVPMSFPADTAYMYNGFTHPDFRGLRLHGRAMGLALRAMEYKGVTRLVSTVDWMNHASLRSCERLGYSRLGRIVTLAGGLALVVSVPAQATNKGVRFGHLADNRPPLPVTNRTPEGFVLMTPSATIRAAESVPGAHDEAAVYSS